MTKSAVWAIKSGDVPMERLFTWCIEHEKVDRLLLILRMEKVDSKWVPMEPRSEAWVKSKLEDHILESLLVSGWPGTELIGHPARLYIVRFDKGISRIMVDTETDLSKWKDSRQPPLPEDMCLYADGAIFPVLITCTHENLGWLVTKQPVKLKGVERYRPKNPDLFKSLLVFQKKYFCKPWGK